MAAGSWHPNLVPFVARHEAGYIIQRLDPGPFRFHCGPASTSDVHLALYQRWALQLLSALSYLHQHGVMLNAVADEGLWLDSDLSILAANLLNAGCREVQVSAGHVATHEMISPWSPMELYHSMEIGETYPGVPKGDLFDWATVVYDWMSGGADPLQSAFSNGADYIETQDRVTNGEFDDWPQLDENQLGPILVRAWKGQYDTVADTLKDVRAALSANGRELCGDDMIGIKWREELEIVAKGEGKAELRRRSSSN